MEEYWIVLPREWQMELYRHPGGGIFPERTVIEGDAVLACASVSEVRLALRELFA